jgi:signal transduction histidine kinase
MGQELKKPIHEWKRKKIPVGLRIPMFILLLIFGIFPMVLSTQTILHSIQQNQIDAHMMEVQNQCLILSSKMSRARYLTDESRDNSINSDMEIMADVYNGRIMVVDRDFRVVQDTFHVAENRTMVAEEVIRCFQGENSSKYNWQKHYFTQTLPIYDNTDEKGIDGVLVVTVSTENILNLMDKVMSRVGFFQLLLLLVLIIAIIPIVNMMMRPFRTLQKKLDQVAAGALDTDISVDTYRETHNIAHAVEQTITKLRAVDESRQEFVSNVSHELKTPITSIRVLADSLMGMEEVPVELYQEFMEDISNEIDRETKIINDLLALVKLDKSNAELNITKVNVNLLVEQTLKRLRPIANRQKIELILESIREVTAEIDEVKVSLAISNLVENAIKYNSESGWVRVTVDADHKFFYVTVADSGIGIPEDEQNKIFERFYRVDKARSRETGGSGLGLAITRNVVLMHKGAIRLNSKPGEGSTFTLRIPLKYIL